MFKWYVSWESIDLISDINCKLILTDFDALLLCLPSYLLLCSSLGWLCQESPVIYMHYFMIYNELKHPTRVQAVIGLSWRLGDWADSSRLAAPACWSMCLWLCASSEENNVAGDKWLSWRGNNRCSAPVSIGSSCGDLHGYDLRQWLCPEHTVPFACAHLYTLTDVNCDHCRQLHPIVCHQSLWRCVLTVELQRLIG